VRFFFDNNLSARFAKAINALVEKDGDQAIHLSEMFPENTPDIEWLTKLRDEGQWVVLTADMKITRNAHERAVWIKSGLTTFFLKRPYLKLDFWDQIGLLIQRWPRISEQAKLVTPGAGFIISPRTQRFEQVRQ